MAAYFYVLTGLLKKGMKYKTIIVFAAFKEIIATLDIHLLQFVIVGVEIFIELLLRYAFNFITIL